MLAVARPAPGGPMTSLGVVSAVGAEWRAGSGARVGAYLRTDTTLYPGFSGGALVDVQGRVLGMNTSRFARDGGFAIPLDAARPIVETLLKQGRLRRAYLGVASQPARLPKALAQELDGREEALLIVSVEENSPAGRAGVLVGDLLIAVAGAAIPHERGPARPPRREPHRRVRPAHPRARRAPDRRSGDTRRAPCVTRR